MFFIPTNSSEKKAWKGLKIKHVSGTKIFMALSEKRSPRILQTLPFPNFFSFERSRFQCRIEHCRKPNFFFLYWASDARARERDEWLYYVAVFYPRGTFEKQDISSWKLAFSHIVNEPMIFFGCLVWREDCFSVPEIMLFWTRVRDSKNMSIIASTLQLHYVVNVFVPPHQIQVNRVKQMILVNITWWRLWWRLKY